MKNYLFVLALICGDIYAEQLRESEVKGSWGKKSHSILALKSPAEKEGPIFNVATKPLVEVSSKGMVFVPPTKVEIDGKMQRVAGFYIDTREVTNGEYAEFMLATGHPKPKFWPANKFDQPVVSITYDDAKSYAKWREKRLPTEAEWEAAARYSEINDELINFEGACTIVGFPNVAEWTDTSFDDNEKFKVVRRGEPEKGLNKETIVERAPMHEMDLCNSTGFRCAK